MTNARALTTVFILLISLSFVSCVEKFPRTASDNTGILVIPHKAVNDTSRDGYSFRYVLSYSPQTPVQIMINPCAQDFLIYNNIPAGQYEFEKITLFANSNMASYSTTIKKDYPIYNECTFEIKAKSITLLDKSFNVSKKMKGIDTTIQVHGFETIDNEQRKKIIQDISNIENAKQWNLPE